MYILVALLLIIVIIFGASSMMQSHATAQQAQAQIEVAQVAQINAWGNLIALLTLLVIILLVLAAIVALLQWQRAQGTGQAPRQRVGGGKPASSGQTPQLDPSQQLQMLLQMKILEMLDRGRTEQLPAPREDEPNELPWLRR